MSTINNIDQVKAKAPHFDKVDEWHLIYGKDYDCQLAVVVTQPGMGAHVTTVNKQPVISRRHYLGEWQDE